MTFLLLSHAARRFGYFFSIPSSASLPWQKPLMARLMTYPCDLGFIPSTKAEEQRSGESL